MEDIKIFKQKKVWSLQGEQLAIKLSELLKNKNIKYYQTKTKFFILHNKEWFEIKKGIDMLFLHKQPEGKKFTQSKIKGIK